MRNKQPDFKGFRIDKETHPMGIETMEDAIEVARNDGLLAKFILTVAKQLGGKK
mgnify:CR=1 FL=1